MSKFQDLLNGKIVHYSNALIVPVEDVLTLSDGSLPSERHQWIEVTCPVLKTDNVILNFASQNGIKRGIIAVGYPFFNGKDFVWKVRA